MLPSRSTEVSFVSSQCQPISLLLRTYLSFCFSAAEHFIVSYKLFYYLILLKYPNIKWVFIQSGCTYLPAFCCPNTVQQRETNDQILRWPTPRIEIGRSVVASSLRMSSPLFHFLFVTLAWCPLLVKMHWEVLGSREGFRSVLGVIHVLRKSQHVFNGCSPQSKIFIIVVVALLFPYVSGYGPSRSKSSMRLRGTNTE